jgi:hypothetical protein
VQTEEDNDPALRLYTDSGYALINGYCSLMLPIRPETRGKLIGAMRHRDPAARSIESVARS